MPIYSPAVPGLMRYDFSSTINPINSIVPTQDPLFDEVDKSNIEYLRVGIDFYTNLNRLEDRVLEAHNYSREEIEQGLHDLSAEYGINLS